MFPLQITCKLRISAMGESLWPDHLQKVIVPQEQIPVPSCPHTTHGTSPPLVIKGCKPPKWVPPPTTTAPSQKPLFGTIPPSSKCFLKVVVSNDPLSYFPFQPVLHDWCNKGCGMCYPVCGMLSYFSFQPVLHDWCNKGRGVLSCLWDGAYKRTLAVNRKE